MHALLPAVLLLTSPLSAAAAGAVTFKSIIEGKILPLFDAAIALIMMLALLGFLWGAVRFIFFAGDDKSRADSRKFMGWGVVALAVMIGLWGIVAIITKLFLKP